VLTANGARRKRPEERELIALRTWLRILACTNLIEKRIRGRFRRKFSTTLPRFDVLAQLDAAEREFGKGLTLSELSRRLMVTNSNLTGLTERLVREGLIHRDVLPHDRRSQHVRLTSSGKRALNSMADGHRQWVNRMFDGLGTKNLSDLYRLIGRLKESVTTVPEEMVE
jgi:DNA-binding MarR family transcriptional regulator